MPMSFALDSTNVSTDETVRAQYVAYVLRARTSVEPQETCENAKSVESKGGILERLKVEDASLRWHGG
jgi:hypothetical protein